MRKIIEIVQVEFHPDGQPTTYIPYFKMLSGNMITQVTDLEIDAYIEDCELHLEPFLLCEDKCADKVNILESQIEMARELLERRELSVIATERFFKSIR
jgi:hypothetical protein